MTTRRNFLKTTGIAAAALPLMNEKLFASSLYEKKTGLALYTVRDAMEKNPAETLKSIAALGFSWLEAASYSNRQFYGMKPGEFRRMVNDNGMSLISSHNAINSDNEDVIIEDAAEAGLTYLILPSLPHELCSSVDGFKKAAEYFNKVGEKCSKNGLKFGFHNHQIEFKELEDVVPYDILLKTTEPGLVVFELDIAWITAAGKNPLAYFRDYQGRFEAWHFKDLSTEKQDATIGEGTIDFVPLWAKAQEAGMRYWFIEQDNCRTHTPLESISLSRNYLLNKVV